MTTFAALGDSITLGVGDPAPGDGWRGWAALLADSLPGGRLVNLAANGARVADVERTQLPRALELRRFKRCALELRPFKRCAWSCASPSNAPWSRA